VHCVMLSFHCNFHETGLGMTPKERVKYKALQVKVKELKAYIKWKNANSISLVRGKV